jgi:uncharacterized protein (DUF433 family)
MKKKANKPIEFQAWASSTGLSVEEVKAAWEELRRRGLLSTKRDNVAVSPLAMRRATSDAERRLTAHLAGYLLTEDSFIVRRVGDPPGLPSILDTRITVEQIANYFKEGWGVTEIERDLDLLTRPEIEAAIQYYLNHREEIEHDMRRSQELYDKHAPRRDTVRA